MSEFIGQNCLSQSTAVFDLSGRTLVRIQSWIISHQSSTEFHFKFILINVHLDFRDFLLSSIRSPLKPDPLFSLLWLFRISKILRGKTGRADFEILKGPVENGTNVLSTDCLFYGQGAFIFIFVDLPKLNWVTAMVARTGPKIRTGPDK